MPKTKRAFALRDFDEKKILQRPPFRKFNLPDKSDLEIVQELSEPPADESIDFWENNLQTLKAIYTALGVYRELLNRHMQNRLDRYNKLKAEQQGIKLAELRNHAPVMEYLAAIFRAGDLIAEFQKSYYSLEKQIQNRYRKEFAARLKAARQKAGMTQRELGDRIQVSPTALGLYETAKRDFSIPTMLRLFKVFTPEQLLPK